MKPSLPFDLFMHSRRTEIEELYRQDTLQSCKTLRGRRLRDNYTYNGTQDHFRVIYRSSNLRMLLALAIIEYFHPPSLKLICLHYIPTPSVQPR